MKRTVGSVAALAVAAGLMAGGNSHASDYLGPELRARVEALKAEANTPTDLVEVLDKRLRTLWDWSNAYALTGGPLPLDYSMIVSVANRTLRTSVRDPNLTLDRLDRFIAQMTREFQIKDEQPGAIGEIRFAQSGPFVAGDFVTIEEIFTVGDAPIVPGGGIMVAQGSRWTKRAPATVELEDPLRADHLALQADDPTADNYLSIRSSNPQARFSRVRPSRDWRLFNVVPVVFFSLDGATLEQGDTITVSFGDTSGGSRGMRVQHWTNDRVLLPIYPVFEADSYPLTPVWPSFRVIGRAEVRRVEAVVRPSVVAPGEPFELTVRSEDRFRQLTSGRTPEYQVFRNGELVRTVAAASPAVTVLSDLRLSEPGVYRFSVRSADGVLTTRSNPLWVKEGADDRVFWGDTHGHSGFADGQGTPDNYYRFARDVSRLDFVTLSEHETWLDDLEWRTLQEMTRKYNDPGNFTAILGYEWTASREFGGHHNVYFRDPDGRKRVTNQVTTSLQELYDGLRAAHRTDDVLIIPHAHQPGDWRENDADMERLVEVNSGHGVFEWYGNRYLQQGFDLGFVGSSDDHTGHPGYIGMTHVQYAGLAAVIAPVNSDETIFDRMRARSTYATTGERIILDASFNGHGLGSKVPAGGGRSIRCRVMGTEPVEAVDLIKNGDVVYSRNYLNPRVEQRMMVQFSLDSSTEVATFDLPRRPRTWSGTVEIEGAELVGYRLPWFVNPTRYLVRRDETNPNRLHFLTNTHGRPKGMLLELDRVSDTTEIRIQIGDVESTDAAEAIAELTARIGDLVSGPATRELRDSGGVDSIGLAVVPDDAALDLEFEFKDLGAAEAGDYYYLRVRQVGGGLAFSSPWRVVEATE